jgi:two-component system phosphate regulon response regulator PhoB
VCEEDKVQGLEAGADDYVTKPFSPKELVARVRAVLRRRAPHLAGEAVEIGTLALNPATHRVLASGQPIELGPTEFRLLFFFMTHSERVYTRAQLLDEVWGDHVFIEERTVDVHIRRLRAALEGPATMNGSKPFVERGIASGEPDRVTAHLIQALLYAC